MAERKEEKDSKLTDEEVKALLEKGQRLRIKVHDMIERPRPSIRFPPGIYEMGGRAYAENMGLAYMFEMLD